MKAVATGEQSLWMALSWAIRESSTALVTPWCTSPSPASARLSPPVDRKQNSSQSSFSASSSDQNPVIFLATGDLKQMPQREKRPSRRCRIFSVQCAQLYCRQFTYPVASLNPSYAMNRWNSSLSGTEGSMIWQFMSLFCAATPRQATKEYLSVLASLPIGLQRQVTLSRSIVQHMYKFYSQNKNKAECPGESFSEPPKMTLFQVKQMRKNFEKETLMQANRIALLKTEENKMKQKVKRVKNKTKQIIDCKRYKDLKGQESAFLSHVPAILTQTNSVKFEESAFLSDVQANLMQTNSVKFEEMRKGHQCRVQKDSELLLRNNQEKFKTLKGEQIFNELQMRNEKLEEQQQLRNQNQLIRHELIDGQKKQFQFFQKKLRGVNQEKEAQIQQEHDLIKQNTEQNEQLQFFEKQILAKLQEGQATHDKNFKKLEEAIDQTFDEFQSKNQVKLVNKQKMKDTFCRMLSQKELKKNDVMIGSKSRQSIFSLEQEMPRIKASTFKYGE